MTPAARTCNTPGCGRTTPHPEHAYCSDCIGTVLRTGHPPVIERAFEPEWLRRSRERPQGLAKDLSRYAA